MKSLKLKIGGIILIFLCLFLFSRQQSYAQKELVKFLSTNIEDGKRIIDAWTQPFLTADGVNLNNGWYVSAEPLKLGRFEFRLIGMSCFSPSSERMFNVEDLELTNLRVKPGENLETSTIFGKSGDATTLEMIIDDPANPGQKIILSKFESPSGTGISFLPSFTPQISIGLVKGTEIMVRWLPDINYSGLKRSSWGIGLKHDILQWIPVAEKLPFSVSLIGNYAQTSLSYGGKLLEPAKGITNPDTVSKYDDQGIAFENSAWSVGAAISKKFPVLTIFGGLHVNSSTSTIGLTGNFPVITYNSTSQKEIKNIAGSDIYIKSKNTQFVINAGLRIKMGIMHITLGGNYATNGYYSAILALGIGYFN